MSERVLPPSDDAEFEDAVKKAFAAMRNIKLGKARKVRALSHVPWMSRSSFYDRYKRNDFSRARVGRPTLLSPVAEEAVYRFAERQYDIGKPVGMRTIQKKLTSLAAQLARPTKEFLRARGLKGFMKRTEAKIVLGQKTDAARFFAVTTDKVGRFGDISELGSTGVKPDNTYVVDECGFAPESHDRRVREGISRSRPLRLH